MIVCSCNTITDREITEAVDDLIFENPLNMIAPVQLYRILNKRPKCGGCLPHPAELIQKRVACLCGDGRCAGRSECRLRKRETIDVIGYVPSSFWMGIRISSMSLLY